MTVPEAINPMLDRALEFMRAGYSVVPAMANASKRPMGTWLRYQRERADEEQIRFWFSEGHPGIGLVCGAVSGGLTMMEAEGAGVREDIIARAREQAMAVGIGDLWRRVMSGYLEQTPGGGIHVLYRIAGDVVPGNQKLARRPADNGTVIVLAETRGEGGFTIIAPSHGPVHPSGKPWVLLAGGPQSIPTIDLAEHTALCSVFRTLDEMPTEEERWSVSASTDTSGSSIKVGPTSAASSAASTGTSSSDLSPGSDFNTRATWPDILTPHGWRIVGQRGQVADWRRPGKTDGISATTGYGGDRGDFLYVFTTSTILDSERAYSKFAAWAALNHAGDFSAAARELRRLGYGGQNGTTSGSVFDLLPPQPAPEPAWTPTPQLGTSGASTPTTGSSAPSVDANGTTPSTALAPTAPETDQHTTWWPRDLTDILAGRGNTTPAPTILARDDGHRILYAGKVNGLVGESESGKSWLALLAVKQVLEVGGAVLFYDFEDTADGLIARLQSMGVTSERLAGFHYVSPEEALHDFAQADIRNTLATLTPVLIVVDGFNAAMTLLSLSLTDNTDITRFFLTFLRPLRANDACVLTVDHVTKNKETRGDYAIGGQAKKAMTDGSYINVENVQPFGRNQNGKLKLTSIKDRPGHVRAISQGARNIGTVDFQSSDDKVHLRIHTPDLRSREERGPFMPTFLMEKVSLLLEGLGDGEASTKAVCDAVAGRDEHIRAALDRLVEQHYASRAAGARGAVLHRTTRPYRQPADDPTPENEEET